MIRIVRNKFDNHKTNTPKQHGNAPLKGIRFKPGKHVQDLHHPFVYRFELDYVLLYLMIEKSPKHDRYGDQYRDHYQKRSNRLHNYRYLQVVVQYSGHYLQ